MPLEHRFDYLAEPGRGPDPSSRNIGLVRWRTVVERQRFQRSGEAALARLHSRQAVERR